MKLKKLLKDDDVWNLLLLRHGSNFVEDVEVLIPYDLFEPRNPDFPQEAYAKFDLDEMAESESLAKFRFRKRDNLSLAEVLDIPETIRREQRSICGGIEGLSMLCRRLSYPCTHDSLIREASPFIQHGYDHLDWSHICYSWSTAFPVESWHLESRSSWDVRGSHHVERSTFRQLFGFIDGTVRPIPRPGENQRVVYNRNKLLSAKGARSGPFQIWSFDGRNEGLQYSNEYCKVFCGMAFWRHKSIILSFWTSRKV